MDPLQEIHWHDRVLRLSAKARVVLARCVTEIEEAHDRLDNEDLAQLSSVASQLSSAAMCSKTEQRRAHARQLLNNVLDAERAAMKWLKTDFLLTSAATIHDYRRGSSTLSANDFKASWGFLCRDAPQLASGALILRGLFLSDSSSDDSSYDSEAADGTSVDETQSEDSDGSGSKLESDEKSIVLGSDSGDESDEETKDTADRMKASGADRGEREMEEGVSLVANALLESVAPSDLFNQLQMAFGLLSLKARSTGNIPCTTNVDVITHVSGFVDDKDFLFFALVCKTWKNVWGQRPTNTKAVTPTTSVSQLSYSFGCGLRPTTTVCAAAIEIGRLDLLRCARANQCPWQGDLCELAAEAGDLDLLQWSRTRGYPWGPKTCALLARGGHLKALQWCRKNGCPWDKTTFDEAEKERDDLVEWAVANGCPDWSDGSDD